MSLLTHYSHSLGDETKLDALKERREINLDKYMK